MLEARDKNSKLETSESNLEIRPVNHLLNPKISFKVLKSLFTLATQKLLYDTIRRKSYLKFN